MKVQAIEIRDPPGGWRKVLQVFVEEYRADVMNSPQAHVVMLADFDSRDDRREQFEQEIPPEIRSRVFLIGSKVEPELLCRELKLAPEKIGRKIAEDCLSNNSEIWNHPHLSHNLDEIARMAPVLRPIFFDHP